MRDLRRKWAEGYTIVDLDDRPSEALESASVTEFDTCRPSVKADGKVDLRSSNIIATWKINGNSRCV